MKKILLAFLPFLLAFSVVLGGCSLSHELVPDSSAPGSTVSLNEIPEFSNSPYVEINGNQPEFTEEEKTKESFETYSDLDHLGRCGVAYACVGQDLMPTEDRESISQVKPSGWQTTEYDFVDGK